jgi:hypothetical protein
VKLLAIVTEICHDIPSVSHRKCLNTAWNTQPTASIFEVLTIACEGYCLLGSGGAESGVLEEPAASIIRADITWHHSSEDHELN